MIQDDGLYGKLFDVDSGHYNTYESRDWYIPDNKLLKISVQGNMDKYHMNGLTKCVPYMPNTYNIENDRGANMGVYTFDLNYPDIDWGECDPLGAIEITLYLELP